ncbi:MAG: hypothetical protein NC355_04645 [Blautia sp.]|nr:hypothetical protein [Blautia sp.]
MFSVRLNKNRIFVQCFAQNLLSVQSFMVDTGALYTCCPSLSLSIRVNENDCKQYDKIVLAGLDNEPIVYYKFPVDLMCINNIDIGKRDIWVTFDKRVTDMVLGFDILKDISFLFDNQTSYMHFFGSRNELSEYVKNDEGGERPSVRSGRKNPPSN